jgi:hypothetical protein
MKKAPKVNEVNEFLEIASDFENPLEVIRESLSNSYDADASEIEITIRSRPRGSDIIIEDDGNGMNERDLESFFDLGNSRKTDSIGYKGHGTKIFYKSDRIVVNTAKDGVNRRAVMDKPWEKLNRKELPEYELTETDVRDESQGTRIKITNFRSGEGFDPESLTYNKIHHYLKWKTIAGSTAHFFEDDPREMDIRVKLGEEIDDTRDELVTTSRLGFPDEQLEPSDDEFPAERMCKHYDPREIEVEYDGETTTAQIVGMVGGKAARNELPTHGRHSVQFGVWFAKDHIKVEQINETISHDNEFIHFFFIVNCQDLELSANRETIRNKSNPVFRAVRDEVEFYLSKVTQDPWFKNYLEIRREGKLKRRARTQESSLQDRRKLVADRERFEPSNRAEVLLAVERASQQQAGFSLQVEDYQPDADIQAIVRHQGKLRNAAIHHQLTEHFENESPLEHIDLIIYWEQGDPTKLNEVERTGYIGGEIEIDHDNGGITYQRDGESSYIELLSLADVFKPKTKAIADD